MRRDGAMQFWRWTRLFLGALLIVLAQPSLAGEAEDKAALDGLFARLRLAPDAGTAQQIGAQIWDVWTKPSDPELARRIGEVLFTRNLGDVGSTILLLNKLVADYPDYAEAWNQRATMYYVLGDFERSIADCAKVLELEPRHFGALSGRALIYLQLGQRDRALRDMAAALAIHPFLSERQLFPELGEPTTQI